MKFNVYFTLATAVDKLEISNTTNPVEALTFKALLEDLSHNLPDCHAIGLECVGIRIEKEDR